MLKRLLLVTAAFAALALPALAGGNGMACRCLYKGKYFDQGETVCIRVDGRSRLARCDMNLNNSSWTFLSEKNGCPTALMSPVPPRPLPARTVDRDRPALFSLL
jgi:hypothetical protein